MQAVRQFGFLALHKWVVERSAMKLFETMDCVFEIRDDLKNKWISNIVSRKRRL